MKFFIILLAGFQFLGTNALPYCKEPGCPIYALILESPDGTPYIPLFPPQVESTSTSETLAPLPTSQAGIIAQETQRLTTTTKTTWTSPTQFVTVSISEVMTSAGEAVTSVSEFTTSAGEAASVSEVTTSASEAMTSISESVTSMSEATTSVNEAVTSVSEVTTSDSQVTTSDSQVTTSDNEVVTSVPTSTTETLPQTTKAPAVTRSISILTVTSESATVEVVPTISTRTRSTRGTINTSLSTASAPLLSTSISAPTSTISALPTSDLESLTSLNPPTPTNILSSNIFQPISTDAPSQVFGSRSDHPVAKQGLDGQNNPIGTNKFYANFFLGSQTSGSWTHPYSIAWAKGAGGSNIWGLAVTHVDSDQRSFGPDPSSNPVEYFIYPVGLQSLVISAQGLTDSTTLSMDSVTAFSANLNLLPAPGATPSVTFPLVQGMGFVTAQYNGDTPILQSATLFSTLTTLPSPKSGVSKYKIVLEDGVAWFVYAYSDSGLPLTLTIIDHGLISADSAYHGIIQVAKAVDGGEPAYDSASGAYPKGVKLTGEVTGATAQYHFVFDKGGRADTTLLLYALPHHVESFSPETRSAIVANCQLQTTTKGLALGVLADTWTLIENLPSDMGFAPWNPESGSHQGGFSDEVISTIRNIALSEVSQDMNAQTNLDSMYFSGKALAKFAGIVYTLNDIVEDQALAQAGLKNLKQSFAVFAENRQQFPLVYETSWKGVVSSATYTTGDQGADFGNTYYNDHHFHYAYFVYTAAVIGYLDPSWLAQNKDYVNTLVRDFANPSEEDTYFPVYRAFDWYHGHSWAHGLYETTDGRDQESSSEDSFSAYALKMWGRTVGDSNMEARGNLQLAITARSLQKYYLYTSDNTVQPPNFIGNKVAGILFENKIDYTTYFGTNTEYIHGIHMIPLMPSSTLTRTRQFVTEEWDSVFSNGRADAVAGGWKGILYANLAIIDPSAAWNFFSQPNFDSGWIDGGASLTWYLALAAGLGGAV